MSFREKKKELWFLFFQWSIGTIQLSSSWYKRYDRGRSGYFQCWDFRAFITNQLVPELAQFYESAIAPKRIHKFHIKIWYLFIIYANVVLNRMRAASWFCRVSICDFFFSTSKIMKKEKVTHNFEMRREPTNKVKWRGWWLAAYCGNYIIFIGLIQICYVRLSKGPNLIAFMQPNSWWSKEKKQE